MSTTTAPEFVGLVQVNTPAHILRAIESASQTTHFDRVRMAAEYSRADWIRMCKVPRFLDALFFSIPAAQVIAAEILTTGAQAEGGAR